VYELTQHLGGTASPIWLTATGRFTTGGSKFWHGGSCRYDLRGFDSIEASLFVLFAQLYFAVSATQAVLVLSYLRPCADFKSSFVAFIVR
jgi:hypothetical protein